MSGKNDNVEAEQDQVSERVVSGRAELELRVFRRSLPMRLRLAELSRGLDAAGRCDTCLEIGSPNGLVSHHLRRRGGNWYSIASSPSAADGIRSVVQDNVLVMGSEGLPFEDKTFDVVVLSGHMERVEEDHAFIAECHRVIKADGWLIVNVAHTKPLTLLRPLRHLLGLSPGRQGLARGGYSEPQLVDTLKDGFDVHGIRSHLRFFTALCDSIVRGAAKTSGTGYDVAARLASASAFAAPFYFIAAQIDMLLFFTRGFELTVVAKRRGWSQRSTPMLVDGRSISEAVLSRLEG